MCDLYQMKSYIIDTGIIEQIFALSKKFNSSNLLKFLVLV